ncbi:MAG: HD domain-containing protein [Actinomycetota bacterium]|nr:HD domain-containing protein [Actinomycetota bacterium]
MTHPVTSRAHRIAEQAHAGQTDKAGEPYIEHPRRVAAAVAHLGWEAEAAAVLHDVIEDSDHTADSLVAATIPRNVATVVALLTRRRAVAPADYYAAIRRDPVALAVKLADVADNADPARLSRLDGSTQDRLRSKYAAAVAALTE